MVVYIIATILSLIVGASVGIVGAGIIHASDCADCKWEGAELAEALEDLLGVGDLYFNVDGMCHCFFCESIYDIDNLTTPKCTSDDCPANKARRLLEGIKKQGR